MRLIDHTLGPDDRVDNWFHIAPLSDLHLGAATCDERAVRHMLREAARKKARILLNGDIFDAILVKDVRRFNMSVLKAELRDRDDILNVLATSAVDFFWPYAEQIDMMGLGNHELSVIKYHSVDLIRLVVDGLNQRLKDAGSTHRISHGGYTGYVRYTIECSRAKNCHTEQYHVLYHHGGGSESPVTKGMIDVARKRVNYIYHLYIFGHKHNTFATKDQTIMCPAKGDQLVSYDSLSVQTGAFMDNYRLTGDDSASNVTYTEARNMQPKVIGCPMVRFKYVGSDRRLVHQALV